jgi:hypothetical protein
VTHIHRSAAITIEATVGVGQNAGQAQKPMDAENTAAIHVVRTERCRNLSATRSVCGRPHGHRQQLVLQLASRRIDNE